jgi:hypothetical protein
MVRLARRHDAQSIRELARELAGLGLPIVPLRPRSKVPALPHWPKRATTDPRTIARWFPIETTRNVGIRTGCGLVTVDIDPRNGGEESFARLTEAHGHPPETATTWTGGDGFQMHYRVVGPVASRSGIYPGIDVKGEGGMVVVPPSIHPITGRAYVWLRHPGDGIAELPANWLRLLTRGDRSPPDGSGRPTGREIGPVPDRGADIGWLTRAVIDRFPVDGPGLRHDQMVRAVGHLTGRRYAEPIILAVMENWTAHHHGLALCRTGVTEGMVEVVAMLATLHKSPRFTDAIPVVDHRTRSRAIHTPAPKPTLPTPEGVSRQIPSLPTFTSDADLAFLDALSAHTLHRLAVGELASTGLVSATNDQLRQLIADRSGLKFSARAFELFKRRFIGRPRDGKPATDLELWLEVKKGHRGPGQATGVPSVYRLTGILDLLPAVAAKLRNQDFPFPEGATPCQDRVRLTTTGPRSTSRSATPIARAPCAATATTTRSPVPAGIPLAGDSTPPPWMGASWSSSAPEPAAITARPIAPPTTSRHSAPGSDAGTTAAHPRPRCCSRSGFHPPGSRRRSRAGRKIRAP